jgi:hypothetical protein
MRHKISKRLKKDIKLRYFSMLSHFIEEALKNVEIARTKQSVSKKTFDHITQTLAHLYVVFPFSIISFHESEPPSDSNRRDILKVSVYTNQKLVFYISTMRNYFFLHNIDFYHFLYEGEVAGLIERVAASTWEDAGCLVEKIKT